MPSGYFVSRYIVKRDSAGRLTIDAIVQGCGGSDDDRGRFVAAWRLLKLAS